MKLLEAIEKVKADKPNAYSEEQLVSWLNQLEKMVQSEIMALDGEDIKEYTWKEDGDTDLLIPEPYDDTYMYYLKAMIDYNDKEYTSYNYNSQLFNSSYRTFASWYKRKYGTVEERKSVTIFNFW